MSIDILEIAHPNCIEIKIAGTGLSDVEFDELHDRVDKFLDQNQSNLILNLEGVKILNSLGINTLIRIFTRCRNKGGDLYIVNISDKINQVLLLTKLNTVLNIAPSVQDAAKNFN